VKVCASCGGCFEDGFDLCSYDGGLLTSAFVGRRVLADRYLLEQRVAEGAMGMVFRATHLQVGSTVAVKLMRPQREGLRVGLQRFWREAQILGQIKHPNAVLVMDFGVEEREPQAVAFLVTEFLRGQPLSEVVKTGTRLSLAEAERIITPLCEAVEEAHEVGVIHRDLKPSNVFLERLRDGSEIVKVLDFGIAKFVELDEAVLADKRKERAEWALRYSDNEELDMLEEIAAVRTGEVPTKPGRLLRDPSVEGDAAKEGTITEAGFMIGTLPYMAPEQMTGERVSRRTDVYAVATLLFELLAGRLPYDGTDDDIIAGKVSGEVPSLRDQGVDVSSAFDAFMQHALELEAQDRPESVLDVSRALIDEVQRTEERSGRRDLSPAELGARIDALLDAFPPLLSAVGALDGSSSEAAYAQARDRVLSLLAPLSTIARHTERLPSRLSDDERQPLARVRLQLEAAADETSAAFRAASGETGELLEYLRALWSQAASQLGRLTTALASRTADVELPPMAPAMSLFADPAPTGSPEVTALARRLLGQDALDGAEALDELLNQHGDAVYQHIVRARSDEATTTLVRGLWRYADVLVMQELYPPPHAAPQRRLLPMLRELDSEEGAPFRRLAALFADAGDPVLTSADEDDPVMRRCLLAHPSQVVRARALQATRPADVWHVVAHPAAPIFLLRALFERFCDEVSGEYLKVFFLCAHERLIAASDAELGETFTLVADFFAVPGFSEDVVFDRLLKLERVLWERANGIGFTVPDEVNHAARVAHFVEAGVSDNVALESMRDIPLPLQRKIAREGHFLAYFVSHANERIAMETLPHLVRLEDVTRYLRIPTIHRSVLTGLAKRRRLLRKESARLALLHNPRAPAHAARSFLPLLSEVQLRLLSQDKAANAEVRQQCSAFLARLKQRRG